MKRMKYSGFFLLILMVFASCTEFSKMIKEPDPDKRFDAALAYYNEGECGKAIVLLEDLLPLHRGTKKSEIIYYYFSKSHFCTEDYILAGFYFKQFVKTFPQSEYSEECSYLAGICSYKESPLPSLDQGETTSALNELQLFLDKYPGTEKKDTINSLMLVLNQKLESKEYNNAYLYQSTLNYKSAVIAYNNFLIDYPATSMREQVMYNIIESNYQLAVNSIERKKEERLATTVKSYHNFVNIFPESKYLNQAQRILKNTERELVNYNTVE